MWLRRVKAARGLRVRATPRACTALLSTSRFSTATTGTTTIPSTAVRHESTQQHAANYQSSLSADMRDARQLLSEKFNTHSLEPDQEMLLERLLSGQDVLVQMTPSPLLRALELVPGLVQGGLTVIIAASGLEAEIYANNLQTMGLRALYFKGQIPDPSEPAADDLQYRELDVLLFHTSSSHRKMTAFLAKLRRPVAVLAIDSAHRASKLSPDFQSVCCGWSNLRDSLRPRSLVCSTHMLNTDVVVDMQRIYGLPKSSSLMVRRTFPSNIEIDAVTLSRNHDKFATILTLLEKRSGVTVILTATELSAADVATKLKEEGYDAKAISKPRTVGAHRVVWDLLEATNNILCIPKSLASHLPHLNIRHLIWHCLAHSPQQFYTLTRLAGRDGASSFCVVLLSEQEIFNSNNASLARSPSLHHIRIFFDQLFRGREVNKAGSIIVLELMRVRLLADLDDTDIADLKRFLSDEGIAHIDLSVHAHVDPGPRLGLEYSTDYDLVEGLEEATGSRLGPDFQISAFIASGLLKHREDDGAKNLRIFNCMRFLRDFSRQEVDSLIQKFSATIHFKEAGRIGSRRRYLDLFTSKACILASVAKYDLHVVPPSWQVCGNCLFCVTHKPAVVTPLSQIERPIDKKRLTAVIRSVPAQFAKDPRFHARVALGLLSTRVKHTGLEKNRNSFGHMRLNGFKALLKAFAKQAGIPDSELHEY